MISGKFIELFGALGIPLALDKSEGPSTKLPFLGILIDTVSQTLRQAAKILLLLETWSSKKFCTKTELQSLVGKLQFAARCIPAGRLFTRRIINLLRNCPYTITSDYDFFQDVLWWQEFLPKWNGTSSFLSPSWLYPSAIHLYTDASSTVSCAGFFNGEWFIIKWTDLMLSFTPSIEWMEFLPILVSCSLWCEQFFRERIIFHSDNLGVVQAWEKLGSSSKTILNLMRHTLMLAATNNFTITIKHIYGLDNSLADALSRHQMPRFFKLTPYDSPTPTNIPKEVLNLIAF